jgi:predicted nucleic-acid-binding Zn-ribbon protein
MLPIIKDYLELSDINRRSVDQLLETNRTALFDMLAELALNHTSNCEYTIFYDGRGYRFCFGFPDKKNDIYCVDTGNTVQEAVDFYFRRFIESKNKLFQVVSNNEIEPLQEKEEELKLELKKIQELKETVAVGMEMQDAIFCKKCGHTHSKKKLSCTHNP